MEFFNNLNIKYPKTSVLGLFFTLYVILNVGFATFYSSRFADIKINDPEKESEAIKSVLTSLSLFFKEVLNETPVMENFFQLTFNNNEKKTGILNFYDIDKNDRPITNDLFRQEIGPNHLLIHSNVKMGMNIFIFPKKASYDPKVASTSSPSVFTALVTDYNKERLICGLYWELDKNNAYNTFLEQLQIKQPRTKIILGKKYNWIYSENESICSEINSASVIFEGSMTFARGLYFSLVTISTLGYGDMSPMNTATRFAVGLESMIGIFLFGVFAALFTDALKKKPK